MLLDLVYIYPGGVHTGLHLFFFLKKCNSETPYCTYLYLCCVCIFVLCQSGSGFWQCRGGGHWQLHLCGRWDHTDRPFHCHTRSAFPQRIKILWLVFMKLLICRHVVAAMEKKYVLICCWLPDRKTQSTKRPLRLSRYTKNHSLKVKYNLCQIWEQFLWTMSTGCPCWAGFVFVFLALQPTVTTIIHW